MRFQCPYCRNVVAVENSDLGLDVQCGHCSEVVSVPTSRVSTGCLIADFIVQEELGRGGMGVVYLSHQISLDRLSALKVLADQYANDAEFVVGFIKEARAAAKLNHPHIVQAYAVGEDEGVFYFAMENVEGETMKEVQKREKIISVDKAVMVIQQIAEALDYAWKEAKLIHRDIKPDNIMMTKKGSAKLADLGLARVAGDVDDSESDEVMGTPQYISPEHLTGAPMDVRSDIYSLGATFFHLITGRFAFEGKSATEIAKKHLQAQLEAPHTVNPDIPIEVSDIIVKMMEKNPKNRYQDAETLVDDLRIFRRGKGSVSASERGKNTSTTKSRKFKVSGTATKISKTGSVTKTKLKTTTTGGFGEMTATGTHSQILKEKQEEHARQSKKKLAIIGVIGIIAAAGGIVATMAPSDDPTKDPVEDPSGGTTPGTTVEQPVEVAPTAIQEKAKELLELKKTDTNAFLEKCRDFFSNTQEPKDPKELSAYYNLNKAFVTADENDKLQAKREEIRKKHLAQIEEAKKAAELKDEKKKELEKVVAQRQKLVREFNRMKKSLDESKKLALDSYKSRLKSKTATLYYDVIVETSKQNFSGASEVATKVRNAVQEKFLSTKKQLDTDTERHLKSLDLFMKTVNNEASLRELKNIKEKHARSKTTRKQLTTTNNLFKDEISLIEQCISNGEALWNNLYNSGTALKNSQLEVQRSLAYVTSISNDIITFKLSNGSSKKLKFTELPTKQFHKLLGKAAEKTNDPSGALFSHYLCAGSISALKLTPDDDFKLLSYKTLISYYTSAARVATRPNKTSLEKRAEYLKKKFSADFSEQAEEFYSMMDSSGDLGL